MPTVDVPRRSFWAWCLESEEPTQQQRDRARREALGAGRHCDRGPRGSEARGRDVAGAAPRDPRRAGGLVHDRHLGARVPRQGRALHRSHPFVQPRLPQSARCRRASADRSRARGDRRLVHLERARHGALRRWIIGGVGGESARSRFDRDDRARPARPGARDRRGVAGGAHPGGRLRPAPRGSAAPARLHAPPLPAVVSVLDARRMDRDTLGRPLRHEPHAHRRLRRVGADVDAAGLVGDHVVCPAAARGRRQIAW